MTLRDEDLRDEPYPDDAAESESFTVTDSASANWVVRKVVEARAYADRVEAWAAAEVRRARNEERWLLTRFGHQLEGWVRAELASRSGRSRSVRLPAGRARLRSVPARVQVVDMQSLTLWCRQHLPSALRVRVDAQGLEGIKLLDTLRDHSIQASVDERAIVTEVSSHVQAVGELPPGTSMSNIDEKFYVE